MNIRLENKALKQWLATINHKKMAALATVLPSETAKKYQMESKRLFLSAHEKQGELGDVDLERKVIDWIKLKFSETVPKSESKVFLLKSGEEINIFIDIYFPPIEIIIFGAGHDAIPLAAGSVALGYPTTVVDAREQFNTVSRFPFTKRLIFKSTDLHNIPITEYTFIVIMNHHIEKDENTLAFALKSPAPYIGLLGPLSRREKILTRLEKKGINFKKHEMKKLNSPIGLDIGAESPEEIAISILGEIIAFKNHHPAGFLHDSEKIHM